MSQNQQPIPPPPGSPDADDPTRFQRWREGSKEPTPRWVLALVVFLLLGGMGYGAYWLSTLDSELETKASSESVTELDTKVTGVDKKATEADKKADGAKATADSVKGKMQLQEKLLGAVTCYNGALEEVPYANALAGDGLKPEHTCFRKGTGEAITSLRTDVDGLGEKVKKQGERLTTAEKDLAAVKKDVEKANKALEAIPTEAFQEVCFPVVKAGKRQFQVQTGEKSKMWVRLLPGEEIPPVTKDGEKGFCQLASDWRAGEASARAGRVTFVPRAKKNPKADKPSNDPPPAAKKPANDGNGNSGGGGKLLN